MSSKMISEKGLLLVSDDQVQIDKIWEKLEKPKLEPIKKQPGKLTKELVVEHAMIDNVLAGKKFDSSFNHSEQTLADNPFETEGDESFEYDDPFEEGDDSEVENINFSPSNSGNFGLSREFSLSQYDVSVKKFPIYVPPPPEPPEDLQNNNRYFQHISTPSEDLDDIEEEEDVLSDHSMDNEHDVNETSDVVKNRLYGKTRKHSRGDNEDTGSGHVICDCDDCINQTDVVDCQCENCLNQRETIHDTVNHRPREVTCECEDCLNRCNDGNEDEDYSCQCDNCVYDRDRIEHREHRIEHRIEKNNNPETDHCKCEDCVRHSKLVLVKNEPCQCEKCVQSFDNHSGVKGHRSPPQGASQEYPNSDPDNDFEIGSHHSHSDRSFDSETDKSFRSSKSKGSNYECLSEKSCGSLDRRTGANHDYEYIHRDMRSESHVNDKSNQRNYMQHHDDLNKGVSDFIEDRHLHEADGNSCFCESCRNGLTEESLVEHGVAK